MIPPTCARAQVRGPKRALHTHMCARAPGNTLRVGEAVNPLTLAPCLSLHWWQCHARLRSVLRQMRATCRRDGVRTSWSLGTAAPGLDGARCAVGGVTRSLPPGGRRPRGRGQSAAHADVLDARRGCPTWRLTLTLTLNLTLTLTLTSGTTWRRSTTRLSPPRTPRAGTRRAPNPNPNPNP